ncbi:hypothetical protein [Stygiolobus caldivivus]|uniref:Uncharacterized protein n=1 Tax=Stygiolobus caldivivus TaxID=2824673 RepID=A0A8D5ZHZ2_9CREN|nr:hypothetical protein [Stygiolobus caldivivus]BCU68837.1 hypothetical protein KN1_01340 [Stygiolobus caldivivus]
MGEAGLSEVVEPETGVSVVELGLVREGEDGIIYYRPISPYTPPILVIALGVELVIRTGRRVKVEDYYLEEEINMRLDMLYESISGQTT